MVSMGGKCTLKNLKSIYSVIILLYIHDITNSYASSRQMHFHQICSNFFRHVFKLDFLMLSWFPFDPSLVLSRISSVVCLSTAATAVPNSSREGRNVVLAGSQRTPLPCNAWPNETRVVMHSRRCSARILLQITCRPRPNLKHPPIRAVMSIYISHRVARSV